MDAGVAAQVIDFAREKGIHSMATPEAEDERVKLAERMVHAAQNAWHGGDGNTGEAVTGVLKLAGVISENGGEPSAPEAQTPAEAEAAGEEQAKAGTPEVPGGDGGLPDGEELSAEEAPAGEQPDAASEAVGEDAQPGAEGEAADPAPAAPAGEAPAGGSGLSLPLRHGSSAAYDRALKRIADTRLPLPADIMDDEPEPIPADVTQVEDVPLRKLYWQRHCLYAYARWLVARVEGMKKDAKHVLASLPEKPEADSPAAEKRAELEAEIHEHDLVLDEVKSLRDWFYSDVEAISREFTMRTREKPFGVPPTSTN